MDDCKKAAKNLFQIIGTFDIFGPDRQNLEKRLAE
jgi:hypothetical protein